MWISSKFCWLDENFFFFVLDLFTKRRIRKEENTWRNNAATLTWVLTMRDRCDLGRVAQL